MSIGLLSGGSLVQTPFIVVEVGGVSFGKYIRSDKQVVYPNYLQSLQVQKVNGALNTYTLVLIYAVQQGQDPNLIDKILSSAQDRKIKISYGDYSLPSFIFKDEEALMTKVRSQLDTASSRITYTINCVSTMQLASAGTWTFPAVANRRPSEVLREIFGKPEYGLCDLLPGMRRLNSGSALHQALIPSDDAPVSLPQQTMSTIDYVRLLVNSMTPAGTSSQSLTDGVRYIYVVLDDVEGQYGGSVLQVRKMARSTSSDAATEEYEVDIGYPSSTPVLSFTIDDDETYSMYYEFAESIQQPTEQWRIGDDGSLVEIYSPLLSQSGQSRVTHPWDKTWWTQVTQYPVKGTLKIRGMLRHAVLASTLRVNVWFYGQKHLSSGVYMITKQIDEISAQGFFTTLSLTRVSGDSTLENA